MRACRSTRATWTLCDGVWEGVVARAPSYRCSVEFDGALIVSGSYDNTVRVWDAASDACIHVLAGHTHRIYSLQVCISCVSLHVYLTPASTTACILSVAAWTRLCVFGMLHRGLCSIHSLVRIHDGSRLTLMSTLGHQSLTNLLHIHGDVLYSGNADSTIRVWSLSTGALIHTLHGHASAITSLIVNDKYVARSA